MPILDDAARICFKQKLDIFCGAVLTQIGEQGMKTGRAVLHIMRVTGDHMGKPCREQLLCGDLRGMSEPPEQAALVELDDIALGKPACNEAWIVLHRRITLGMSNNGNESAPCNQGEGIGDVIPSGAEIELGQKIARVIQRNDAALVQQAAQIRRVREQLRAGENLYWESVLAQKCAEKGKNLGVGTPAIILPRPA